MSPRRSKTSGARRRPARYREGPASPALAQAIRLHKRGEAQAALAQYEALEDDVDAALNAAALWVLAGRARAAEKLFARGLALAEALPPAARARALRDAGMGLAALGHVALARTRMEQSLALDPTLIGALLWHSRLSAERGDDAAAIASAERAVEIAPEQAAAWLELFRARFDDRCLQPAERAIARAVELDPGYALARLFAAGVAALRGRVASAPAGITPGLADALSHMTELRGEASRSFATSRATLHHALDAAPLEGPVLELGVRHGTSLRILAERCAGPVIGFDSFEGLPLPWYDHPAGAFTTAGELPEVPANVELVVGWFEDTLPRYLARGAPAPRLVHIDSDLYESARQALFALGPSLKPGCVVVFDEYFHNEGWRGDEHRAFVEASAAFGWRGRLLSASFVTGQAAFALER